MPTTAGDKVASTLSGNVFTCNLTNLNPGTTYYVRAYAINNIGTSYGEEIQFITGINIPELTTTKVTLTDYNVATSGGTILSNGGDAISSCGICYSTVKGQAQTGLKVIGSLTGNSFSCEMKNLYANTTYYVCAYATNKAGTSYGGEVSYTTYNSPTVSTSGVLNITQNSASIGCYISSDGGSPILERGICYSTSHNPTVDNSKITDSQQYAGIFTISVTELIPNSTYYVKAYAKNSVDVSYGNEIEFTTKQIVEPSVITDTVLDVTSTTATISGSVTSDGGSPLSKIGIYWSTTTPVTLASNKYETFGTTVSKMLTGLTPATIYYIKAYAENANGLLGYGNELSFRTPGVAPIIDHCEITMIHPIDHYISFRCMMISDGGEPILSKGFVWSLTNASPTIDSNGGSNSNFSLDASDFNGTIGAGPGQTYYIRAFVTNSIGTTYSNVEKAVMPVL
jgi:hypothetical protein